MKDINYSYSKSFQREDVIKNIYEKVFRKKSDNLRIKILDGGMKCAVYLLIADEKKWVLKIASTNQRLMLSYERNTMWWEVKMLKLMKKYNIPSPELIYYDDTLSICKSPYFIMSYIEGEKLSDCKSKLNKKQRDSIEYTLGKICFNLSKIENNSFFIPSYKNVKFSDNYEFIRKIFSSLISDAKSKNIIIPNHDYKEIMEIVDTSKNELNSIEKICLVHSDIWDGNIIIKDGNINGVIDFADLYFCDELFNFYFHTTSTENSVYFMKGFGKEILSTEEKTRIYIYKIFTILKMIVEKDYKEFDKERKNFDWLYKKLDIEMKKIKLYKKVRRKTK